MNKVELKEITNTNSIIEFFKKDSLNIEISYLSYFSNTKKLRDILNEVCIYLKINKKDIYKIILIIDEMNNNAIEYGSKIGDLNKIRIKITKKTKKLTMNIEVEDTGSGSKTKKALSMEELRKQQLSKGYIEHDSIRGRGLFLIIINLVDKLYFKDSHSGGLIVGIKKNIYL